MSRGEAGGIGFQPVMVCGRVWSENRGMREQSKLREMTGRKPIPREPNLVRPGSVLFESSLVERLPDLGDNSFL